MEIWYYCFLLRDIRNSIYWLIDSLAYSPAELCDYFMATSVATAVDDLRRLSSTRDDSTTPTVSHSYPYDDSNADVSAIAAV
jgi:hypothetical protein